MDRGLVERAGSGSIWCPPAIVLLDKEFRGNTLAEEEDDEEFDLRCFFRGDEEEEAADDEESSL